MSVSPFNPAIGRRKFRLLLVNCYREGTAEKLKSYRNWLRKGDDALGLELEIRVTTEGEPLPGAGEFSAVILSGSHKMVGEGEIEAGLIDFLRSNRRPLLGICYGHQALARAFGGFVKKDRVKHHGNEKIRIERPQGLFSGFPGSFEMSESHEEIVARDGALIKKFHVLAESGPGLVEAIRHRERPLYGVQFHPERSGVSGVRLLANFLNMIPEARPRRTRRPARDATDDPRVFGC
ncbi:MAG: type 1 glutamine amidotransferase [Candidatus Aminicenantales bacterium]